MFINFFSSLILGLTVLGFAETNCENAFRKLNLSALEPVQINLKKAQEVAEDFVNRKVASEVLTDPGVEAALEDCVRSPGQTKQVEEAFSDALEMKGMSPGQAKRAAEGWTKALIREGIIR